LSTISLDDIPHNLSWGLPSSGTGSGEAAPKKTLKQIQEEEERRKANVRAANAVAVQQASAGKRGYADLAANTSVR
jgi:PERQ amino acid-rich with GYF domain-containing protein